MPDDDRPEYEIREELSDGEVECSDGCGAKNTPKTYAEYRAAYRHWRWHSVEGGCSHAC